MLSVTMMIPVMVETTIIQKMTIMMESVMNLMSVLVEMIRKTKMGTVFRIPAKIVLTVPLMVVMTKMIVLPVVSLVDLVRMEIAAQKRMFLTMSVFA